MVKLLNGLRKKTPHSSADRWPSDDFLSAFHKLINRFPVYEINYTQSTSVRFRVDRLEISKSEPINMNGLTLRNGNKRAVEWKQLETK
jgi:hypothetical protein